MPLTIDLRMLKGEATRRNYKRIASVCLVHVDAVVAGVEATRRNYK